MKATMSRPKKRMAIRSRIPSSATEVITEKYPDGSRKEAECFIRGRKAGARSWYENGQLADETQFRNGRRHGIFREWHPNGQLLWQTTYRNGKEHGTSRQWSRRGKLLGTYRMNRGTGVDQWWHEGGRLAEEHHWRNGEPHGFERWWWDEQWGLSEERHWRDGVLHGIWREWWAGRLRRGFPRFYVNAKRAPKLRYLRADATDSSLPPYDPRDDRPQRSPSPGQSTGGTRRRRGGRGR